MAGHRFNGGIQYRVHKRGVRTRADLPPDDLAIEAVDHRGQVHFAGRDLELLDASQLFLIRCNSGEVPVDEVFRRRADLAEIGTVSTSFRLCSDQALLLHHARHHLL